MFAARSAVRSVAARSALARSMATAAASSQPPVQLFGLDGSYASALYTAAAKSNALPAASASLSALKTLLAKDSKLDAILSNPALSASDKKTIVETLASSVKADKTVTNFLSVIADNNRLALLGPVAAKFETLINTANGVVEATITSAQALDTKTLNRLQTSISKSSFVGEGKKLQISNKVNPEILGGLIVEVGDRTVDLSVAAKISKLNKLLSDDI
ncbi:uncharacterized protein SAPINGB_P004351 [Magnusiomyces paraingens]|uniref:ATP synthase subunit 5, mitochondrial n=1 Tax=Magnusiomyces paraingens TaxID=2606893 RepID=A0A5E8C1G0_9ASCO|nr:uncharacterized protein SAPINGB_P004351 [Saprochaete ingens]VVT54965.1 unnamed protein product [Saprochaete ingens]